MWAVLSLLLACLLAQAWLAPGSTLASRSLEVQAGLETLLTARAQNQTNQTSERLWTPEEEVGEEDSPWLSTEGQKLSGEASNLGFSLLRKISLKHDGNVVFSPLGLAWAMAALTLGAGGHSRAQLQELLSQTLNQTRPPRLPALFKQLRESLSRNPELGLAQGSFAFIHKDFDIRETFQGGQEDTIIEGQEASTRSLRNPTKQLGFFSYLYLPEGQWHSTEGQKHFYGSQI